MRNDSLGDGIDGIVLDAVGTLIEPWPPVVEVYAEAARRQGVALDREGVRARFHQAFRDDELDEARGPLATDEATEARRWRRIVAGVLPGLPDPDAAFHALWEHFGRADAWRCFADVGPALASLAEAGRPVRIASNFDARLRGVVDGLPELSGCRDRLVISSEVGYRKPHPAFYRAACESLHLPPARVLCVGDDLDNDVLGAIRAGLRGVLLDRRGRPAGDDTISRVSTLLELIGGRRG